MVLEGRIFLRRPNVVYARRPHAKTTAAATQIRIVASKLSPLLLPSAGLPVGREVGWGVGWGDRWCRSRRVGLFGIEEVGRASCSCPWQTTTAAPAIARSARAVVTSAQSA